MIRLLMNKLDKSIDSDMAMDMPEPSLLTRKQSIRGWRDGTGTQALALHAPNLIRKHPCGSLSMARSDPWAKPGVAQKHC